LVLFPIILGAGKHLVRDEIDTRLLRLDGSRRFKTGIVPLTYQPDAEARKGRYLERSARNEEQIRSLQAA
jgi:hypothetical protein